MYYVRYWLVEHGQEVMLDEGPFDYYFASLVIADAGVDASISRGLLGRAFVNRAIIIEESEAQYT